MPRPSARGRPGSSVLGSFVDVIAQVSDAAMPDTIIFTRPGSGASIDPVTLVLTPTAGTVVYSGPCRVQSPVALVERAAQFNEQQITEHHLLVGLPAEATGIEVDDVGVVTACEHDVSLEGRPIRVIDLQRGSFTAERYVLCDDNLA